MYSIIYNDKGVELTLGTFKSLKTASKRINNINLLFRIPLGKKTLNQYKKNAYIKDERNGAKYIHIFH